jgi:ADP-dependent NAD(P)H-hydrate dehydratase / NAD(P)H-hydrate epimerase
LRSVGSMPKVIERLSKPQPLLTTAEMTAVDAAAVASGLSIDTLMAAAGKAVADATPYGQPIAILCGPGNNGGDGYIAACVLRERGADVKVFASGPPRGAGAASRAASLWQGPVHTLADFLPSRDMIVIDALYGAGLTRPIYGAAASAIARLNASGAKVIAVDIPSGLDGDSGQTLGPVVRADRTVTFFRAKPGHYLWPGRALCGELIITDIGLDETHVARIASPSIFRNAPALWWPVAPQLAADAHKYQRGHCLVISGPELQTGASRLSAQAALNAGAGAVTLAGGRESLRVHATHVTAIMLREAKTTAELGAFLAATRFQSGIIGPAAGVSQQTREMIDVLLASGLPLVLDADALTVMVGHLDTLASRAGHAPLVLTPHAGEFGRLFAEPLATEAVYAALPQSLRVSKIEMARAAARLIKGVVVFKGIDTVIADGDGRASINCNGGPELATAGSGDVLAGLIGAHLAQGMPAFEAAAAAVWLHATCGAAYGTGLTADRLVNIIRPLAAWSDVQRERPVPA